MTSIYVNVPTDTKVVDLGVAGVVIAIIHGSLDFLKESQFLALIAISQTIQIDLAIATVIVGKVQRT
jgi:hypothetical protein